MEKLKTPLDLAQALAATLGAKDKWASITPIAQRDFISWIEGAKQPETRARRVGITCDKLISGKRRPCCYAVIPMSLYKALDATPKAKATWKTLTPDARRDFVSWIDDVKDKGAREQRIKKACMTLATGKVCP